MKNISLFIICHFACLAGILAAGSVFAQTGHKSIPKIGMILPLSGQYAAIGEDCRQGFEIAKSEIDPAIEIDFTFADSRAEPAQAVAEFRKLTASDRAIGVFAFRGPVGMSVNPLSKAAHIPLLGGVGNKNFAIENEYAFQLWPSSDYEGSFLANAVKDAGIGRVAILTVQDDYTMVLSEGFRDEARRLGIDIVYDSEILPSESDLRSQIPAIKRSKPDMIFLNVSLAQLAPFMQQLRQQGVNSQIAANFWAGKKEIITAAASAAEGVIFPEMSTDLAKLRKDLREKYNSTPSAATLSAYVATAMIAQAFKDLANPDSASLYKKLKETEEIRTANGNFRVIKRYVQFPMVIRKIQNGNIS